MKKEGSLYLENQIIETVMKEKSFIGQESLGWGWAGRGDKGKNMASPALGLAGPVARGTEGRWADPFWAEVSGKGLVLLQS